MDRQVLYNTHGLLLLFTGAAVALLYRTVQTDKRDLSALWIATASFCGGFGLIILSTPHSSPVERLGCCLFLATPPLLHVAIGAAARESVRRTLPWVVGASGLGYVLFLVTGSVAPALVPVPAIELATFWILLRNRHSITRLANIAMVAFLALHVALFCVRIGAILSHHPNNGPLAYGGMFIVVGIGVSFVGMEALRSRHEFERMAMTDALTGLLNRRALDLLASRELLRCKLIGKPCSALMLDIDRFKEINDTMGHAAGDASLCAVAGILQSLLSPADVITRYGGDEFFVLLSECDEENAALVVARLRQAIAACILHSVSGQPFQLNVSIGVTTATNSDATIQDLLHASDIALYREKPLARTALSLQEADDRTDDSGGAQVQPSSA